MLARKWSNLRLFSSRDMPEDEPEALNERAAARGRTDNAYM